MIFWRRRSNKRSGVRIRFYYGKRDTHSKIAELVWDPSTSYTLLAYSDASRGISKLDEALRLKVESATGHQFNRALVNYTEMVDSVDWHADDEPELGLDPIIASVSLGAEREFQLRHNTTKERLK